MTSQRQQTRTNKMLHYIQENGSINKFDLMDLCGMSVGDYNQIASWFKYRYEETGHLVEYDKPGKSWRWIGRGESTEIEKAMQVKN